MVLCRIKKKNSFSVKKKKKKKEEETGVSKPKKSLNCIHFKGKLPMLFYIFSTKLAPEISSKTIKTICLEERRAGRPLTLLRF